jgi:hypothetical protein
LILGPQHLLWRGAPDHWNALRPVQDECRAIDKIKLTSRY